MQAATRTLPEVYVRPWARHYGPPIRAMLRAFIQETQSDLAPTDRTVRHLWTLGLAAAEHGDPCLVLQDHDGTLFGFTFWMGFPVDCDTTGRICQAMGTYLKPAWRRQGWGTHLREAAALRAAQNGYTRITATAYTTGDTRSLMAAGFTPAGRILWQEVHAWHSPP